MTSKSSTITKRARGSLPPKRSGSDRLSPIHPGEVLREEFLLPSSLSVYRVAKDIGIPSQRLNDVVLERRSLTADTAIRLARYFGTSEQFWMSLQTMHDLDIARDSVGSLEDIRAFTANVTTAPRAAKAARVPTVLRDGPRLNDRSKKK